MSEVQLQPAPVPPSGGRPEGGRVLVERLHRRPGTWGVVIATIGVVVLVLSLDLMHAGHGSVRYLVTMIGAAGIYTGLRLLARRTFGSDFDLGLWLSVAWLVVIASMAALADLLPLSESRDVSRAFTAPINKPPDLFSVHPLGTDNQGLDLLGGILYGARVSLIIGVGAVFIGITMGLVLGLASGYYGGKLDGFVSLITDSMLAFPPLILLLAVVTALSPSVGTVTVALSLLAIPTYIRLARANTLTFAQRDFVLAARVLGERNRSIMLRELLPNVVLPVMSFSFLLIAVFIVAEASLSFLGLSVSRPNPTWGNMIASGQDRFDEIPHIVFVPGAVLFLTVFAFNSVGDAARKRWDPREAQI